MHEYAPRNFCAFCLLTSAPECGIMGGPFSRAAGRDIVSHPALVCQ
ncbi:MAG TPA: hypothetical protein [Caudoviricetes sp.]|nr:MAG TPA: hypothetical protein [Caudoviricetes sp.]